MPRLRANWAQRVPALALGAAVLPHRSSCPTRLASMRPVERVPELQGAAIFLEGLSGLPAPLEDGAEERVDDGRAGHADLDLLQLVPASSSISSSKKTRPSATARARSSGARSTAAR